jgi:hypothetical protein
MYFRGRPITIFIQNTLHTIYEGKEAHPVTRALVERRYTQAIEILGLAILQYSATT